MHKIESLLVLVSPNLVQKDEPRFLLLDDERGLSLPAQDVGIDSTCLGVAANILTYYTSLKARIDGKGWVELVQGKLADSPSRVKMGCSSSDWHRYIGVPFGGMVPSDQVDLNSPRARWVPLSEVFHRKEEFLMDHFNILHSTDIAI